MSPFLKIFIVSLLLIVNVSADVFYRFEPSTLDDTMARRDRPSDPFGSNYFMTALTKSSCNNSGSIMLVKFDISSFPDNVKEVYIGLTHLKQDNCYSNCRLNYYFYPILESWNEDTVTYNTLPNIDFNHPMSGPYQLVAPSNYGTREYNITSLYRAWKDNALQNYGFAVYSPDGGCNNAAVTFSVYTADESNVSRRPYLRIITTNTSSQNTVTVPTIGGYSKILLVFIFGLVGLFWIKKFQRVS